MRANLFIFSFKNFKGLTWKVFILPLFFSLCWILSIFILNYLKEEFPTERSLLHRKLHKIKPSFVFIGSSRFYGGIDLAKMPQESFILSIPYADATSLKRILMANWERIKLADKLILEMNTEMFYIDSLVIHNSQFRKLENLGVNTYFYERVLKSWSHRDIKIFFPEINQTRLNPRDIIATKRLIEYQKNRPKDIYREYGSNPFYKTLTKENLTESNEIHLNKVKTYFDSSMIKEQLKAYHNMINFLNSQKKAFTIIRMPIYPTYKAERTRRWDKRFLTKLNKIFTKTQMWNLEDFNGLKMKHFADVSHLNKKGSSLFSDYLFKRLQNQL